MELEENGTPFKNSRKNNISLEKIQEDLETIKYALIGNELTRDGGLIRRVEHLEQLLEIERLRINAMEKYKDMLLWLIGLMGGIPVTVGTLKFILDMIQNSPK